MRWRILLIADLRGYRSVRGLRDYTHFSRADGTVSLVLAHGMYPSNLTQRVEYFAMESEGGERRRNPSFRILL